MSKQHRITRNMMTNLNIHPEDDVSSKTDLRKLHKANITEEAATANIYLRFEMT